MQIINKFYKYFFSIVLSLFFLTAYMQSDELAEGINSAKMFYFYLITVAVTLIGGIGIIIKRTELKISFNILDVLLLVFWFYNLIRLIFTPFVPLSNDRFIILTILIGLYFIWKEVLKNFDFYKFSPGYIVITAFLISGFYQSLFGLFQLHNVFGYYSDSLYKVTGTLGNPGPFSGYIITVIPFAFGLYLFLSSDNLPSIILKYLGLAAFFAGVLILPATSIRGGWLAATVSIGYLLISKYEVIKRIRDFLKMKVMRIVFVSLVCIISITSCYYLYNFKPNSAFGRILIWKVSFNMIKENPLFGLGYDTFSAKYGNFQSEYFAVKERSEYEQFVSGNNKWAFNEFIETSAELGITGLILFTLIFCTVFIRINSKTDSHEFNGKNDTIKNKKYTKILVRASIIAILIFSITGYPFKILPTLLNTIFLLSLFSTIVFHPKEINFRYYSYMVKYLPKASFIRLMYATFLFFVCALLGYKQVNNYKSYLLWGKAVLNSAFPNYNLAIYQYSVAYKNLKYNGNFLLNYGGTLSLAGRHKEAVKILEQGKRYNSESNLYLSLGRSYEASNDYLSAKDAYLKAINMRPNLFYPKYLMAKFYEKQGRKKDAILLAKNILGSKIKINSTAVDQIKDEMKKILKSQ